MALPKYNGGLTEYLNAGTKSALNPANKIEEIDFQQLIPHENNFYGMRDIPALAKDMSISNWVEPLRVQPSGENGKYIILSGERRYRAVMYRYERGEITSRNIPCIVTEAFKGTDLLTPEMVTNIAIIMANSHRVKNFSERLQEIAVLEPMARIYYQKAKDEKRFLGNFREYFAEQFLNISTASLQRLRGLQSLIPEFMQLLDEGKITQMVASELSKHSQQEQREFMECMVAQNDKTADFKYSDVKSFFGSDEREAEDKAEVEAEIETKAEVEVKVEAEVENEVEVETEVEDKAEIACVSNMDMQEQEEERKKWTPTSGWVRISAEDEAKINKNIEEQGIWELEPCMMCRSGTRCVGCCKICQNHCGMRQNCSREQENSRNDDENNVSNVDTQKTENITPVQEASTQPADEMPVEDDREPGKDALCDTPELPTPTPSPAASVQADISKVNISNEGMNIVISYLQSGLDERKRGLTKADEAGDIELAARYEMEVASFNYAIIKLSKMAEEQSAG